MRPTVPRPALPAFAIVLLACASSASPVLAQTPQGAIVSGVASAFVTDAETALSVTVAAGYRFNRAFGLGIELTAAPSIESDERLPLALPARGGRDFLNRET